MSMTFQQAINVSIILTLAITLISFGVNLITSGSIPEGIGVVVVGLLIIVVYYLIIIPSQTPKLESTPIVSADSSDRFK